MADAVESNVEMLNNVHDDLKSRTQFCARIGKQPFVRYGKAKLTPKEWRNPQKWLTFDQAVAAVNFQVVPNGETTPCNGIGWMCGRNGDGPQIVGGDLDCCVDPGKGTISPWANAYLLKVKPFYTETSPSMCGLRFFVLGRLPGGRASVFGHGPQDDMVPETRERILAAKPKAREKFAKGEPVFNGLELYETGRHLTLTGLRLDERCYPEEDQTAALSQALAPFLVEEPKKKTESKKGSSLPQLDIQEVIDTSGFTLEGDQLFGPHPTLGSTTGRNLVVNPGKNVYCYMHNGINAGGDPWTWLACECGALVWEKAGAGALQDRVVLRKTLEYAVSKGLVSAEEVSFKAGNNEAESDLALEREDVLDIEPPKNEDGDEIEKFNHSKASDAIIEKLPVVQGEDGKLYYWHGKIWEPNAESEIYVQIDALVGKLLGKYQHSEVVTALKHKLAFNRAEFNKDPFLFPAIDGVVDLKSGEIRQYSPDDMLTFSYNAYCTCPKADYDQFLFYLASSLPDIRDCFTAIDLITKVVIRLPYEKFVFLLGGGENGKGILEKIIIALLKMGRISTTKIEEIKKSHFATGHLLNKDAWIITEVETISEAMSIIKGISSGEPLESDVKYGVDRVQGIPHLLTIIDSNRALDFKEKNWGRRRRTLKLDFPYEFGYKPDTRPKDPFLLDKLTTPESLAGILQVIRARAPSLIASRRIYMRKSSDEQEAELDRQRFSLQHFCNECLCIEADWPEKIDPMDAKTKPPRLTVDDAYSYYLEYCKLWNVPEPSEKVPFGRYISEKYGIESTQTSTVIDGKKKTYRFYSGLFCGKSPVAAHAEIYADYSELPQSTPVIPQIWVGEINSSKENTPDTSDKKVIFDVVRRLEEMYTYVHSCENPREISYKDFFAQLSGVSGVISKSESHDSGNEYPRSTPDQKSSVVLRSPDAVPQSNQKHSPASCGMDSSEVASPRTGQIDRPTPAPMVSSQMLCRQAGYEPGQRVKLDEAEAREWEAAKVCAITGEV